MDYKKIYDTIVEVALIRATSKHEAISILGYVECHHIIPFCLGGINEKTNLVYLSAREHYVAHQLLVKIYPNEKKLIYAANMMTVDKTGGRVNNRKYEWIKRKHARQVSEDRKGKTKENDEGVRLGGLKRSGENHPMFGATKENNQMVANIARINSSRTKENDEGRRRQSEKISGANNHFFGKTKQTCPILKRISENKTGKNKFNDPGRAIMAEKQTKIKSNIAKQLVTKRDSGQSFEEIHSWLSSIGINVSILTVRRTYNRETNTKLLKRGGQNKLPNEIIYDIISKKDNGETFKAIHQWVLTLGIEISEASIKNNYIRYKRELNEKI
jgi:hypothetical protein